MGSVELKLISIGGYHIDTDKGEMTIRNVKFSFDTSPDHLAIDFLVAIKIALAAIESGDIKLSPVN